MIDLNKIAEALGASVKSAGSQKANGLNPSAKTSLNQAGTASQQYDAHNSNKSSYGSTTTPDFVSTWGYTPPEVQPVTRTDKVGPKWSISSDLQGAFPQPATAQPNMSGYESMYSSDAFAPLDNSDRGTAWWRNDDKTAFGGPPELDDPSRAPGVSWLFSDALADRIGLAGENTVNERYLAMARDHGVTDEELNAWLSGQEDFGRTQRSDIDPNQYWDGGNYGAPDPAFQSLPFHTEVDDGTAWDYAHMASPYMTGSQYRYYVNQGMGGLAPEQIDDNQIYNKYDELADHGFQPFTPNGRVVAEDMAERFVEAPFWLGQHITHAREAIGRGYKINKDGIEVDGRTFDREAPAYMSQIDLNSCTTPPARDDVPYSTLVREYVLPGEHGGSDGRHYGEWYGDPDTRTIVWEDGTHARLSPSEWTRIFGGPGYEGQGLSYTLVDVGHTQYDIDPSRFSEGEVFYVPDMVMSDGTQLNYAQAASMYFDDDVDDTSDGIEYTYGLTRPLPSRLTSAEPFVDEDDVREGHDTSSIPLLTNLTGLRWNDEFRPFTNVVDWTLGSVPIMLGAPSAIYSLSGAAPARYGFDTASYNPYTHTYRYLSGGLDENGNMVFGGYKPNTDPETMEEQPYVLDPQYTEELRAMNMLGNATVPLTESLAGNVGPDLLRGRWGGRAFAPADATLGQTLSHHLRGTGAEALEEVVGNPFEELSRYGISRFYSEPLRDEYGNILYDRMGHEIRRTDTPWYAPYGETSRLANFLNSADIANAMFGGAGVSLLLGGPNAVIDTASRVGSTRPALNPNVSYEGTVGPDGRVQEQPQEQQPQEDQQLDLDAWEKYLREAYNK